MKPERKQGYCTWKINSMSFKLVILVNRKEIVFYVFNFCLNVRIISVKINYSFNFNIFHINIFVTDYLSTLLQYMARDCWRNDRTDQ